MLSIPYKTTGLLTYTAKVNGVATDAVTITVQVIKPDGTNLWDDAKTPTNTAAGTYEQEITAAEGIVYGRYKAVWTWTYDTSSTEDIEVFEIGDASTWSAATLCTRGQVKDRLKITSTTQDDDIDDLIRRATATISKRYQREFVPQQAELARAFRVDRSLIDLHPYDLRAATTVTLHPGDDNETVLVSGTDFVLLPIGGLRGDNTGTYHHLRLSQSVSLSSTSSTNFGFAQIEIEGDWGIWDGPAYVDDDVNSAAIETVCAWINRPASEVGNLSTLGDPRRIEPSVPTTWDIPSNAHRKLQMYSRNLNVY